MGSTVSRPAPSPPKASPCSLFDVLDVRELREELLQHVPLHTLHALKASRALRAHAAEAIAARGWGVAAVDVSCGVHVKLLRALVAVGGRIALADGLYDLHQQPRKTLTLARATTLFAASAFRGGEGPGLGAGPRVRIVGPKYADALTLCARAAGLVRLEGVAVHAAAGVSGGKCVAVERPGVGDNERWLAENVVGRSYNGPIAQGTRSQPSLTLLRCELRGKVVVQEGAAARLDGCSLRGISVSEDALWCAGSLVLLRSQVDAPLPAAADELQVARRTVSGTEAGQRDCVFVGNQGLATIKHCSLSGHRRNGVLVAGRATLEHCSISGHAEAGETDTRAVYCWGGHCTLDAPTRERSTGEMLAESGGVLRVAPE